MRLLGVRNLLVIRCCKELDLFPSAVTGWETPALLDPLEGANRSQWRKVIQSPKQPDAG
jgi:hypothetical protein